MTIIITSTFRKWLYGAQNTGKLHFDIFPIEVFEHYYGKYSQSAKAYRIRDIPDPFIRDIVKFFLKVGCIHLNAYGMPKQKAGVVISTFKGTDVDWGVVTGTTLREGPHTF